MPSEHRAIYESPSDHQTSTTPKNVGTPLPDREHPTSATEDSQSKRAIRHRIARSVDAGFLTHQRLRLLRPLSSSATDVSKINYSMGKGWAQSYPDTNISTSGGPSSRSSSAKMNPRTEPGDLGGPIPPRSSDSKQLPSSDYSPSIDSSDRNCRPGDKPSKSRDSKNGWLSQVKDWFATGEPSAQDFKQLRKQEFKKRGIHLNDPDAHAKMHAPIGQIPRTAIRTAGGPNPDKQAIRRAEQRDRQRTSSRKGASISSASSSSTKLRSSIAPWET